jgi:uncharacterized protein
MLKHLPKFIDPLHFADKQVVLKGQIPLKDLDRLADKLVDDSGMVDVDLYFGREGRLAKVEGHIVSILEIVCQNCLEAIKWPIDCDIKLGIIASIDQASRLSEDFEPLLVEDGSILLKDIIQDEIILALPAFPRHQYNCFAPEFDNSNPITLVNDEPLFTENPFSILAKLKNTGDL